MLKVYLNIILKGDAVQFHCMNTKLTFVSVILCYSMGHAEGRQSGFNFCVCLKRSGNVVIRDGDSNSDMLLAEVNSTLLLD